MPSRAPSRWLPRLAGLLVALLALPGCGVLSGSPRWDPEASGSFPFAPAGRSGIPVYFARGSGAADQLRIVVVMHGTDRNARDYRRAWEPIVSGKPLLVLVPEFAEKDFPGLVYNTGGMIDDSGASRPPDSWLFGYIEALVDSVHERLGSANSGYDLFGHSAGAQFVHRFVMFGQPRSLGRAVAANAGWYTMPDGGIGFPYGLRGVPATAVDRRAMYDSDLTILLGSKDVETENLRQDAGAMAQGATRVERGQKFFAAARFDAIRAGVPFRWSLEVAQGIAHDYAEMSAAAAARFALPPGQR